MKEYKGLTLTVRGKNAVGLPWNHPYKYLIHDRFMAHTAFRTKDGLKNWLKDTGLKVCLGARWRGLYNTVELKGSYRDNCMMNEGAFNALEGRKTRVLSNGDYTLGKITTENGVNTIHYLNPNCNRVVLHYGEVA